MKRPDLIHGILVAALLSLAAPALYHIANLIVPRALALKVVLAVLLCGYVLYLLQLNRARIGNITLGAGTLLALLGTLLWGVTTPGLVFVGITLIWVVRSVIAYSSMVMSLTDGALCLLSLGVAAWAFGATGNIFWAIWCFFLSQSLFTLIPERLGMSNKRSESTAEVSTFSAAHKAAEAALRELARKASRL